MTQFLMKDTQLPQYMAFPRFLLDMEQLNETAKILYVLLLDRARLSQKNEGWTDELGRAFIFFPIKDLAEVMHKSEMSIKTALAVLEKMDLIYRKRQAPGLPNKIYVKIRPDYVTQKDRNLSPIQTVSCPADGQETVSLRERKLSGSNKEKNNIKRVKQGSKDDCTAYGKYQNVFLSVEELKQLQTEVPLCREYIEKLSSYIELGQTDWKSLLTEFIQDNFVADGMCADVAIHDPHPPGHNPHAHIMLTVRPLKENGTWQHKTEKEYLCVKDGEECGFTAAEFKTAQADGWEKQYQYLVGDKKVYMAPSEAETHGYERANKYPKSTKFGRQNPISERWNSEEQLFLWRENWATVTNKFLAQYPWIDARIDHRSHAARGLDEQPTIHEGYHARKMEAMGFVSDRCEINRQIKADNALLREIKAQVKKLTDAIKNSVPELANALESLRENMIVLVYRIRHIRAGKQNISDYVDAVKPTLERYTEIKQEIKEKTAERKQLRSEQDALSFVQVIKHHKLSEQITTLTEDIEELKSEKSMILKSLDCADDTAFRKAKKSMANLETQKETLEQAEVKFTAELNSTLEKYNALEQDAASVDADELTDTRIKLRTGKEQSAANQLQKIYGDKYDYDMMRQSKLAVKKMLREDTRKPSIKQTLHRKEPEVQMPKTQKKKQKEYER